MGDPVHWLFEARKSPELAALLQLVEQAEIDGRPKYTPHTCRELGRILVCRAYAPALLELSHLAAIASACGPSRPDRVERFFWDSGLARGNGFRAYLSAQVEQADWRWEGFHLSAEGAHMHTGGSDFTIHFSRMPLLSALMEFLVSAIGYADLDETLRPVIDIPPAKQRLSATANALAKRLYRFLSAHLPSAQEQRKFHRLIGYLAEVRPEGFDHLSIRDPLVLDFWQRASLEPGSDGVAFRTFSNVFRLFVNLRRTLEQVENLHRLETPRPIGNDREAGEIDPGTLLQLLEAADEPANPLTELRTPPVDRIKFLNRQEQAQVERLVETGATARDLPLSLLRCEVFEPGRKRLTQALRDRAPPEKRAILIGNCAQSDYTERVVAYRRLRDQIEKVLLATFHLLLRHRDPSAPELLLALRPGLDLRALAARMPPPGQEEQPGNGTTAPGDWLLAVLGQSEPPGGPLRDLLNEARHAFGRVSRTGFKEREIERPEIVAGLARGHPPLVRIRQQIERYLATLDGLMESDAARAGQFRSDREIFTKQFHRLYGEAATATTPETPA